jgi:LuxR family maltose regulon positive regulatory protein
LQEREADALLRAAGLDLSDADVAELTDRTEGWPAGLYLGALSLRGDAALPSEFRGADRFVSDYFRDELLGRLKPSRVRFLTRASVLDKMCGPLCDAVLETTRSALMLEELEASNLFVVPLDHERCWYRFHHLFRDMLGDELDRREPELGRELNLRAADWCEQQGDSESAIEYAHKAGDLSRVARLLTPTMMPTFWSGRMTTLARWLRWLDDPALLELHPAFAILGADIFGLLGQPEESLRWAEAALRADDDTEMPDGSPASAWKAELRSGITTAGPSEMVAEARLALATLAAGSPRRTGILLELGIAQLVSGDDDGADSSFADAIATGLASGALPGVALSQAMRSLIAQDRDDVPAAAALAEDARDTIRDARFDDFVMSAPAYAAGARAALRRSDWSQAQEDLARGEALLPQITYVFPAWAVKLRLEFAKARLATHDVGRAAELVDEAFEVLQRCPDLGVLGPQLEELRVRVAAGRRPEGGWESSLTPAELRLLPLLTTHLTLGEVAQRLYVSRSTVKTQTGSLYRKLGVSSRSEAVAEAVRLGLVEPEER